MNRFSINLCRFLLLATLLLFSDIAGAASAGRNYDLSFRALKGGKFERAEEKVREALKEESQAREWILISGGTRYPYLPYYVLGAALSGQGKCPEAVDAWRESLRQGQIQQNKEYGDLEAGLLACGTSVAAISQSQAAPAPAVDSPSPTADPAAEQRITQLADGVALSLQELKTANSRFATYRQNPDLVSEWSSVWKPRLDISEAEHQKLASEFQQAQASNDLDAMAVISTELEQAINSIVQQETAAESRIDTLSQQRLAQNAARDEERKRQEAVAQQRLAAEIRDKQEAEQRKQERETRDRIAAAQRSLRQELESVGPVLSESRGDERVVGARRQLAQLVVAGRALLNGSSSSLNRLDQQIRDLRDGQRRYLQVVQEWEGEQREIEFRTPPEELRRIADAYFAGDYESTLRLAQPAKFDEPRQIIQAYLFRSAAKYNLYWLTGGSDEVLRENARRDIMEIKQLDRNFQPYVAAFSPRFVDFFRDS